MRWTAFRRWMLIAPLLGGCLFQVSCGQILKQSLYQGTMEFLTGQVSNTFDVLAPISDLLLSILTGQSQMGLGT